MSAIDKVVYNVLVLLNNQFNIFQPNLAVGTDPGVKPGRISDIFLFIWPMILKNYLKSIL